METQHELKLVSSKELPENPEPKPPSKTTEALKLSVLLVISLVIWAAVIWYLVMMWRAR